jgi:hypothetical protein
MAGGAAAEGEAGVSEQVWSTLDEVRQRLGNFWRLIALALLALRVDSHLFAAVMLNAVRDEGDGLITRIERDGRRIDVSTSGRGRQG